VLDTVVDVLTVDVPGLGLVATHTTKSNVDSRRKVIVPPAEGGEEIVFDHFSCYLPGLIYMSLGVPMPEGRPPLSDERRAVLTATARGLTETCSRLYDTASGLSGEVIKVQSTGGLAREGEYNLRPEVVEALFYESRLSPSAAVRKGARDKAWQIFQAIERHCRTPLGYAAILNPNAEPDPDGVAPLFVKQDRMPTFLIAETFKYLYLTFQDEGGAATRALDLSEWVFTTEAHPLRIR
jgi:hypothetical protein